MEYNGRTPLFDSPVPKAITGRFEYPVWIQPNPADKDIFIYDEMLTANGFQSVYGSLSDPGKHASASIIRLHMKLA